MTGNSYPTKQMYIWLGIVLAVITAGLILGMKFLLGDNNSAPPPPTEQLFKKNAGELTAPGYNPAARSGTSSGGGLDMFSKANAGLYGEEESTGTAPAAPPAAVKPTAAVKRPAVKEQKRTAIPRLKPMKAFVGSAPTEIAPHSPGQSLPDINALMKQAQEQAQPAAGD